MNDKELLRDKPCIDARTGEQMGEQYPCKPDIFAATYEPVAP